MLKRIFFFIIIVSFLLIIILFSGTIWMSMKATHIPPVSQVLVTQKLVDSGINDSQTLIEQGTTSHIPSPFGYTIDTTVLYAQQKDAKKFIILNHDFGEDKIASLAYYNIFHQLGFNVVIYSQRHHGQTGGNSTTYGFYEKYDLGAIVVDILKTTPDAIIGLHGVGLGAATVLAYNKIATLEIDFYIIESAFPNISAFFDLETQQYQLLNLLPWKQALNSWWKLTRGFSFDDLDFTQSITTTPRPLLLLYGSEDPRHIFAKQFKPLTSSQFIQIETIEGATKDTIMITDPEVYQNVISDFIDETLQN